MCGGVRGGLGKDVYMVGLGSFVDVLGCCHAMQTVFFCYLVSISVTRKVKHLRLVTSLEVKICH